MKRKHGDTGEPIFGYSWAEIQSAQRGGGLPRRYVDLSAPGDYGADPVGDGTFRMVPSGDVVSANEMSARLARRASR
jgi:hypothetical protein